MKKEALHLSPDKQTIISGLESLFWCSLPIVLRNNRNTFAREHPLSILNAVCKAAAIKAEINSPWFIHPNNDWGSRVRKDSCYGFECIFTLKDSSSSLKELESQVIRFSECLAEHLFDPRNNFELVTCDTPRLRNIAEIPAIQLDNETRNELCLDFITPLPYSPKDKTRNWHLDAYQLFTLIRNRLRTLFGYDITELAPLFDHVSLLTCFWDYFQTKHKSKSQKGFQYINGMLGPLYLKGNLTPLLPLLRLCSEMHIGRRLTSAQGCYQIETDRRYFDEKLEQNAIASLAWNRIQENSDALDGLPDDPRTMERIINKVRSGEFSHSPVACNRIQKKDGSFRCIGSPEPEDAFVHSWLAQLLTPEFDKLLEHSSVGYRRGRSIQTAFDEISKAASEGFTWIVESDIDAFFDSIDLDLLWQKLDLVLPEADQETRHLIKICLEAERYQGDNKIPNQGLLQGSALSPLLANLFLDSFDEAVNRMGYRLIRFADDFIVLTKSRQEAEAALRFVTDSLAELHLKIKEKKTGIVEIAEGFTFLGQDIHPGALLKRAVAKESLKKNLYVTRQYSFIGLDHDSVVIKRKNKLVDRFPLLRIGEIIIMGNNSISTGLIRRCSRQGIPLTFATSSGAYETTARPDSKFSLERLSRHLNRFEETPERGRVENARLLVNTRMHNVVHWLRGRWPAASRQLYQDYQVSMISMQEAESTAQIRGHEGALSKKIYAFYATQVNQKAFESKQRLPHLKPDRWNSLLDFLSYLLFSRINTILRGRGLNPYLGFLHSHKDNFESLVCDLQEPFRFAIERLAINLINLKQIRQEHFEIKGSARGYWLTRAGMHLLLEAFEKELMTQRANMPGNLLCLIAAQVRLVQDWVDEGSAFSVWRFYD